MDNEDFKVKITYMMNYTWEITLHELPKFKNSKWEIILKKVPKISLRWCKNNQGIAFATPALSGYHLSHYGVTLKHPLTSKSSLLAVPANKCKTTHNILT